MLRLPLSRTSTAIPQTACSTRNFSVEFFKQEFEQKTYGSGQHHDTASSHRQSNLDYIDRTASSTQQTPQPSKQRIGVSESDRQSKRHQARAEKSTKSVVSAFGKHGKLWVSVRSTGNFPLLLLL
ncbi:unnamed protein product [Schistocephalus solidus]|uniref:Uncharacterized protein n=1 Tax=Schistocephalus solidus TaxID=70667 RepID=A0A183SA28_SCHSO|nr:unnamed protein product [Schistocephalus solidus]